MAANYQGAAVERRRDAAYLRQGGRDLAAIYVLGYAVECGLKALLELQNRRFARSGRIGHDLPRLWETAGFKRGDARGYPRLFLDNWSVALRYSDGLPVGVDPEALYRGGTELASRVQREYNRTKPRKTRLRPRNP